VNYGANGWVSHQVTDLWAKTSPDAGDPGWALWPMGGPWLATHLWEHYSFTMDKVSDDMDTMPSSTYVHYFLASPTDFGHTS
jgi:alpha-L-fucosidase 2